MSNESVVPVLDSAIEAVRLEALRELQVLDTTPDAAFDDLVWLATRLCETPIALVSLVDDERQWFKARVGLDVAQTPRALEFCAHAIGQDGIFEVTDALADARFAGNAMITDALHIRFYAGAPLVGPDGHRFGTLCVMDTVPRQLDAGQREGLVRLARRASDALEVRRQRVAALAREKTLAHLLDVMPGAVITCDAAGMLGEFNRTAREWTGVDPRGLAPERWAEHFCVHGADGTTRLPLAQFALVRAWRGEIVRDAEVVLRAGGQPPRHVLASAEPVHAPDGRLLGAVCVLHDITHLKVLQEQARLASARFEGAFASAAQGMALVGLDGRWLEVNDSLCAMLGYARDEMLQLDFQRLTHPEDLRKGLDQVDALLRGTRASYRLDKRYFHKDGRTVRVQLSVSLMRDAGGEPLHFVVQIQDDTQRHTAEQRLRESEQRLRSVLEHSLDAFVSVDQDERIVEWNRAAEATFGWRRGEAIGRTMTDLIVPPHMRATHRMLMARYLQTGESRVLDQRLQLPAWHRSGHEFPIEITISVVDDGGRRRFDAFLHDITDRAAAETRLRESEQQLRTIADNVPALIGQVGADLRYRFVNQAYADWYGRTREDIVGRHMSEVLNSDYYDTLPERLDAVLAGQAVTFEAEVMRGDGLRHMQVTYIPDRAGSTGAPVQGFHLMASDVTAQVRLARMHEERALTDALTGLPNRAAWSAELERAVARAQRSGTAAAVMFIDLDGFKQINDTFGHDTGDAVLVEFAERLRRTLRRSDFVARLAGDEFVVLLDRVTDAGGNPPVVAAKLMAAMQAPMQANGRTLQVTPSIGVAVQSGPEFDAAALMREADEAMYVTKRARPGMALPEH